jgi:hypothetical protein
LDGVAKKFCFLTTDYADITDWGACIREAAVSSPPCFSFSQRGQYDAGEICYPRNPWWSGGRQQQMAASAAFGQGN